MATNNREFSGLGLVNPVDSFQLSEDSIFAKNDLGGRVIFDDPHQTYFALRYYSDLADAHSYKLDESKDAHVASPLAPRTPLSSSDESPHIGADTFADLITESSVSESIETLQSIICSLLPDKTTELTDMLEFVARTAAFFHVFISQKNMTKTFFCTSAYLYLSSYITFERMQTLGDLVINTFWDAISLTDEFIFTDRKSVV